MQEDLKLMLLVDVQYVVFLVEAASAVRLR